MCSWLERHLEATGWLLRRVWNSKHPNIHQPRHYIEPETLHCKAANVVLVLGQTFGEASGADLVVEVLIVFTEGDLAGWHSPVGTPGGEVVAGPC